MTRDLFDDIKTLEKQAYEFLAQEKFEEAYRLFRTAARHYKNQDLHRQATLCFASAASCWGRKMGEKAFSHAASSYEEAALEASREGDFEYASLLYRYAAINYERDMEFVNFSECFYRSKECFRRFLAYQLFRPSKIHAIKESEAGSGPLAFFRRVFQWVILSGSAVIWGHGERPSRTFLAGLSVILVSAVCYSFGRVTEDGIVMAPRFFEALYLSTITFATVGYGDIVPLGFTRLVAMVEAFSGIFVMPLFLIGLSRKYLRM